MAFQISLAMYVTLVCLALITLYGILKNIINSTYCYAIGPLFNKVNFKSKGKWALVTGCTDGIGKEYARQLAAKGCNIVLVSRNLQKLQATAAEIHIDFSVETKIIQADFTQEDIYEKISIEIEGLEIGTLVNNVGISYDYPEYFLQIPDWNDKVRAMFSANMVSVTRMMAMIMPDMVKRKKGVIINIASATASIPSPLLAVYGATKAYIQKLTEAIRIEYAGNGIIVQCVNPGYVTTNMSGIRRDSLLSPTPKKFVRSALALVGSANDTNGYYPHFILFDLITSLESLFKPFAEWATYRSMRNVRSRYLKKYKRQ
ncbi:hypothetical protein ACJJTC_001502 [Scirpophaga incertulas]